MTQGIYGYMDLETREVVYIGKDSRIDIDRRHFQHMQKSKKNAQPFNRILQANQSRYKYARIIEGDFDDITLNGLEIQYIEACNPKFNYTKGGDGVTGFKHSEESKRKISESAKGRKFSAEHRKKLSENVSKKNNTNGYYRVYKKKEPEYKQGFRWVYRWADENGKRHEISSVDINKLEAKVKAKGLPWKKL